MSQSARKRLAMMTCRTVVLLAAVATTAFVTNALVSRADDKTNGKPTDAEMAKMMEEMMKIGSPGPQHDVLKMFNGEWKATTKCYMPGQEPCVSTGETESEMMLDGRFSHQHYKGYMMMPGADGKEEKVPFEGVGVMGYDNLKKEYFSLWMDNMGTMVHTGHGQYDTAKKELTIYSVGPDCMAGFKDVRSKWVTKFHSPDKYTFEMHKETAPNQWMKIMDIEYTRDN